MTPVPAYRLRPMHADDLPRVLDLERRLFPADSWSTSMFRDELRADGRYYQVAEIVDPEPDQPAVIGYAGLRYVPPEGDVQTIAVHERWWGSGVGTALLTALLTEAERLAVTDVFLDVRSDNPRAQRLYQWFGFTEIGVRRGYYRDGVDSVVMRRQQASVGAVDNDRGED
ncbi:ribosomal protein S18-alanine N-acetyltransferase [Spiractinospora alimapuensis]|uniref:ribosomal protein S18-alanine N-acetyltransferase n=1 Tax=Spiractinospora alimapuensis TaxID=2820884 RepID=UPI0037427E10|nr:ribosomal protein S18-alanine N-acetyltransferase [Spiractinospora alimapuensis]